MYIPNASSDLYEIRDFEKNAAGGGDFLKGIPRNKFTPEQKKSVQETCRLLTRMATTGTRETSMKTKLDLNAEELIMALELDDDPMPAIDFPYRVPMARIIISPDVSGSCEKWFRISTAWADALAMFISRIGGKVAVADNYNAEFNNGLDMFGYDCDLFLYLGDSHGYDPWNREYKKKLRKSIFLSSDNNGGSDFILQDSTYPKIKIDKASIKDHVFVHGISPTDTMTWVKGLKLALKSMGIKEC